MDTAKDQVEQVDRLTLLMTDANSVGKGLIKQGNENDWLGGRSDLKEGLIKVTKVTESDESDRPQAE